MLGERALHEVNLLIAELKQRGLIVDDNNNNNNNNATTTSTSTTDLADVMLTPTALGRACDRVGIKLELGGTTPMQ